MAEPDWLLWGRELAAIAQTGLAFTRDPYDAERYRTIRALAARIMAAHSRADGRLVEALFGAQEGYATPKVDVRAAVIDASGRILMVREVADGGRWTLPGGWADVNQTAAECVVREVREEAGYEVRARKLAAVWDRTRQGNTPSPFSIYKFFFVCELTGGAPATSLETSGIGWFAEAAIPYDLSFGRVVHPQIARMFEHWRDPGLPTEFD
jgi:ADP-ribose pyrophosphatase YjhB (NUDIX family)